MKCLLPKFARSLKPWQTSLEIYTIGSASSLEYPALTPRWSQACTDRSIGSATSRNLILVKGIAGLLDSDTSHKHSVYFSDCLNGFWRRHTGLKLPSEALRQETSIG